MIYFKIYHIIKMEYIIIVIICVITLIILKFAWNIKIKDIKKLKEVGNDKKLNEITNKLPENKEICKAILKKLNNETVKIKEDSETKSSLYIAISNSIIIANIKDTFTRVQTVAHECLHSIQNRRTLLFNFIYSNIYFLYFLSIVILGILKIVNYPMLHIVLLIILGFIYYAIRSYLEMDAMTKAKFLAKEYMNEEESLSEEERNIVLKNYDTINEIGIKLTNFKLIFDCLIRVILFTITIILRY